MSSPENTPAASTEPSEPDVVDVIDRTALIENVLNQIIVGYCAPRQAAWEFMWSVVLDTSVMSLGAKTKVVLAVAHELGFKLNRDAIHNVIALRNAFAHHATDAHPVFRVGATPEKGRGYLELWVLEGSGKIQRIEREKAFTEFNKAYRSARESLVALRNLVGEKYKRDGV